MTTATITIDDLKRIMLEGAGQDEGVNLDGDISDMPFESLGYDSLALLETVVRVQTEFGVVLPDDIVVTAETPRQLIEAVNS